MLMNTHIHGMLLTLVSTLWHTNMILILVCDLNIIKAAFQTKEQQETMFAMSNNTTTKDQ